MAAFVMLGLTSVRTAHAESAVLGRANGPWFAGASGRYIRDGRRGTVDNWIHDGVSGWGTGLEAGRAFRPWLAVALVGRIAYVGEEIWIDPGIADFTERQLSLAPRIDFWPVLGRVRTSVAVGATWRRSTMHYPASRIITPTPEETIVSRTATSMIELQGGVVPLRWHGYELEVNGSLIREYGTGEFSDRVVLTFSAGLGLRWRTAGW